MCQSRSIREIVVVLWQGRGFPFTCRQAKEVMKGMQEMDEYNLEMRQLRGADPVLSAELEDLLKKFVADAYDIGVPRSRSRLAIDIQQYVRQENIEVPFVDQKPGEC